MATSSFGERLKREREMRGVSLDEITAATRISARFLLALENEHWNQLPGGVFNRGFIRSVARYLGLDEEALLAEYAMATNDRPQIAPIADGPAQPRHRLLPWLLFLIVIALGAGGWFAWQHFAPMIHAWRNPAPPPPKLQPGEGLLIPAPPAEAGPAEPEILLLKVDAGKATNVKISADGKLVFDGRISPGESKSFRAKEGFEISADNSGAVLIEMNGRLMPAMGLPDTPGQIKLSRADLRKSQGGPN